MSIHRTSPRIHRVTHPVSGADGVWLQDRPENLMVINSVFTLDHIGVDELRRAWMERLLGDAGSYRYPRFAQRIVETGGRPYWQDDPDFDIARHIFTIPEPDTAADAPDDKEKLEEYVGRLASQPLPSDRPLWQLQLIPRFGDDGSAVVFRIHHVMGDGIGLVGVLFSLMDGGPTGGQLMPAVGDRGGKPPNPWLLGASAALAGPTILAKKALWRRDRSGLHGPRLGGEKRVAWTRGLRVDRLKTVKNHYQTTLNDVLVSCVAGAFRRYSAKRDGDPMGQLQVSMPINVRSASEPPTMDNQFAAVLLSLPVDVADPFERLAATKECMDRLKRSVEPFATYGVVRATLATLPFGASRRLLDYYADKCSCVLSNVPGPQESPWIAGKRLHSMLFWVPQRSEIGIGISLLSFAGELRMGVLADTVVVPDPRELVADFEHELALLEEPVATEDER